MHKNLITAERRNRIIQMINSSGSIKISDTAALFDVSSETIRKDLIHLDEQGLLKKSHGGAVAIGEQTTVSDRSLENFTFKNRIALKAIEFIKGCSAILIDSGSTALALASIIPKNENLTIITNSLAAANVLIGGKNSIYFIGGELSGTTLSANGLWTIQSLALVQCDIVFLGSSGFMSHDGPTAKTFIDAQTKESMVKSSRKRVVLADSSKFTSNAIVKYASWSDIDVLITDTEAPDEKITEISKTTEVILA